MKKIIVVIFVFLIVGIVFFISYQNISTPKINSTIPTIVSTSQGNLPTIPFTVTQGFAIHVFANNLGNPRTLVFSPQGTLLVSNPSGNEVVALPDKNNDAKADIQKIVITGEDHVHGLAFYKNQLYIADVDKVVRYNWNESTLSATKDKVLFSLPQNNDHNNRSLVFNSQGQLFISVGSTCNVCKETPQQGGSVWMWQEGHSPIVFATGLRNAAFLAIQKTTNMLWSTEMGRDNLGDNTPPDEIDNIEQNKNYGWPYCYGNRIHDDNFDPKKIERCNTTIPPLYEIPAHSAPLGIAFISSSQFPQNWQGDLLVAYHGDWNRSTPTGFKIVHLTVTNNTITHSEDFLTGFLQDNIAANALGRPVGLIFDTKGNLYISDDKAGNIYIMQKN